jgi:hypothetical protein
MSTLHEWRLLAHAHDIGMRRTESGEAFVHRILDVIDQFLHSDLPVGAASTSAVFDQPCDFLCKFTQKRIQSVVLLGSKIRQHEGETPASLPFLQQ